ncbi:MAG: hypothetical protein CMG50_02085 [Candidatus Marinimicrobia bacterium]|nr:hypothetical protein [Candidatus Neomarinimicrobiota bacterium]|tara:strand:+ start:33718 stop:34044 length:327 start_codon:yes stop_codon:yes gene_type:complete
MGILYNDPLFVDANHWNFNITLNSPCINYGNPNIYDFDGSISDIGALQYNPGCMLTGDFNNDNYVDILDVIKLVNCVLFAECSNCSDLNNDSMYNVLDIIDLVNIIIN